MIDRIGKREPPRLFIREWMKRLDINAKKLAERMDRAEGTVSKLLGAADPPQPGKKRKTTKVTIEYLAEFAAALNVEVSQLFHDPERPTRDELLKGYSVEELTTAVQLIDHSRASAAKSPRSVLANTDSADDKRATGVKRPRRAGMGE